MTIGFWSSQLVFEKLGITDTTVLYSSARTLVRRVYISQDKKPAIIKSLAASHPSAREVSRLRYAFEIQKNFDHPGITKVLEYKEMDGHGLLYMEDIGGVSLFEYMGNLSGQPVAIDLFLNIARQLVMALAEIHQKRVIHKDIHPGNIVVQPQTLQVQITDFDIASLLSRELPILQPAEALEGNLGFMSPEQTGRMNRAIDYRSDFYSLGVTLYWLLTGRMPFDCSGGIAMVHAHIARSPLPINSFRTDVPIAIINIIDRLMAKNAESRYQSALGLHFDLEMCSKFWGENKIIPPFELGAQDFSEQFQISQKLYGREPEIALLLHAFEKARRGRPQMLAVGGYAGVGKSVLVHEAHKPIATHRGWFISGKFDQFNQNIPYSALHGAFRTWLQLLLAEGSEALLKRRNKVIDALGGNARVLIDFYPDMAWLVGELPELPAIGALETQNRFYRVMQQFIAVMTQENALVLFLDDLQWADLGTLGLLKALMADGYAHVLVVVAFRDNELNDAHPAFITLHQLEKDVVSKERRFHRITIEPLAVSDIARLLRDTFHVTDDVEALATLLQEKTAGNPFFINEFLRNLYGEGLIRFDYVERRWDWDMGQIRQQSITENVVDLMLLKMRRLPEETQRIIQIAACIGTHVDQHLLSQVADTPASVLNNLLWPALQDGLIFFESKVEQHTDTLIARDERGSYQSTAEPVYRFAHDRMLQAAYESLDLQVRRKTHLAIGQVLQAKQKEMDAIEVFGIAEHLNEARTLLVSDQDRIALAALNLDAARQAKAASAWGAAARHCRLAREMLPEQSWLAQNSLTSAIYLLSIECEVLVSEFEVSEELAELALHNVKTDMEKARICYLLLNSNIVRGRREYAIKMGVEGLHYCGIDVSSTLLQGDIEREKSALKLRSSGLSLAKLIRESVHFDERTAVAASLLSALFLASFVAGNRTLNALIACKSMHLLLDEGLSDITASLLGQYAAMLVWEQEFEASFELALLATNYADQLHNKSHCLQIYLFSGSGIWFHFRPFQEAVEILQRGVNAGLEYGDVSMGVGCLSNMVILRFAKGDPLSKVADSITELQALMDQYKLQVSAGRQYARLIQMLRHPNAENMLLEDAFSMQELAIVRSSTLHAFVLHLRLHWHFWNDQFEEGLALLADAELALSRIPGMAPEIDHRLLHGLMLARQATIDVADGISKLNSIREYYKKWTTICPANFTHKYALINAQIAERQNDIKMTIDSYHVAISSAHQNGFLQFEALAQECLGRYLCALGWDDLGGGAIRAACHLYDKWGCEVKVQHLKTTYSNLLPAQVDLWPHSAFGRVDSAFSDTAKDFRNSGQLDLESVMKSSQAISSELVLKRLLEKMLHIILENAGAQVAAFVVENNGQLVVEARTDLDGEDNEPSVHEANASNIEDANLFPVEILRYVMLTGEALLLKDIEKEDAWQHCAYIKRIKPQSILCMPMFYRDQLRGVLYLENNLAKNAFGAERIQVLNLLIAQATISLENARLFDEIQVLNASLEHKVEQRTVELKSVNQELETFSYSVSHDLRGPLRNINGFSKMLLDQHKSNLSDVGQDLLRRICRNTDKMSDLIAGLLVLSQVARSEMHVAPVDLAEMARSICEELQAAEPVRRVTWKCPDTVYVNGDHRLLYAALENMLNNAWKYTAKIKDPLVEIGFYEKDGGTIYFIRDNGAGFDMRYANKLFASFSRLHNERDFSGTGIGLATVQRIIKRHGGEIWAESEIGKGTTFYFTLG